MSDEQIKHMVDRFLGWKLPDHFSPDNGVTFTPTTHQRGEYGKAHWPSGTNLLDATQAQAMIQHIVTGLPASGDLVGAAEAELGRYVYRRIEALMDAKPGTAEAAELAYLATIAESVEEYGEDACGGKCLAPLHASDCATHNAPALEPGSCDCGAAE